MGSDGAGTFLRRSSMIGKQETGRLHPAAYLVVSLRQVVILQQILQCERESLLNCVTPKDWIECFHAATIALTHSYCY